MDSADSKLDNLPFWPFRYSHSPHVLFHSGAIGLPTATKLQPEPDGSSASSCITLHVFGPGDAHLASAETTKADYPDSEQPKFYSESENANNQKGSNSQIIATRTRKRVSFSGMDI